MGECSGPDFSLNMLVAKEENKLKSTLLQYWYLSVRRRYKKDGILKSTARFLLTDDFKVMPVAMADVNLLNEFGKHGKIEERTIIIGREVRPAISNLAWLLSKFESFYCLILLVFMIGSIARKQKHAAIVKKSESIDALQQDVAAVKSQSHNKDKLGNASGNQDEGGSSGHHQGKIAFPTLSDRDQRGWMLKAEWYFRYYDIQEKEKVDVASMHLEGDALVFYSWISTNQTMEYWEDLVCALHKNPDEYLCSLK
ncbi:hypothetical protein Tco_0123813 [Tanacetum coccineum]